jgi:hypothetical protein
MIEIVSDVKRIHFKRYVNTLNCNEKPETNFFLTFISTFHSLLRQAIAVYFFPMAEPPVLDWVEAKIIDPHLRHHT